MRGHTTATVLALALALGSPSLAQSPVEGAGGAITRAAAERGVTTCLPAIDRLASNLGRSFDIGLFIFNQREQPDTGLVSLSLELSPAPSGSGSAYVSASFVALPGGACQVMVESTISWTNRCVTVGVNYPNYRVVGTLLREIGMLSDGGPQRLFLLPTASNGCISIEKSVYF